MNKYVYNEIYRYFIKLNKLTTSSSGLYRNAPPAEKKSNTLLPVVEYVTAEFSVRVNVMFFFNESENNTKYLYIKQDAVLGLIID